MLFVTPEYNRSIPGGLKNAIDWVSRPWGKNSFTRKPSGVIGASTGMIGTAVACLGRIHEIVPTVQDLGRRHSAYGVQYAHYDAVAESLLWTLEQCLDPDFTPEIRDAWQAAYATLSNVMKDAANEPDAGAAVA